MFRNTSLKPNTIFKENSIMDSVLELYVSQFSKSTEFNFNSKNYAIGQRTKGPCSKQQYYTFILMNI